MSTCIRYKISNRLKVNNAAFCKPSDINPITGNPIYRDFFTHSKLKAIHKWVTTNIYYDMDFYAGKTKTVYLDAGDAFVNKRTTCWGYAAIESYMLQRCGIPAVVAYGKTTDYYNQPWEEVSDFDKGAHSWVMTKIDGIWYNCDPTGDSGNRFIDGKFVQNIREWHWFCFSDEIADNNYAIRAINRNELDKRNKTGFFKKNGKLYFYYFGKKIKKTSFKAKDGWNDNPVAIWHDGRMGWVVPKKIGKGGQIKF